MLILAVAFTRAGRSGWAFAATGLAAIGFVATVFTGLYPRVLVSSPTSPTASRSRTRPPAHYALQGDHDRRGDLTPLILLYQGWTYHVLRARISGEPVAGYGSATED